MLSSYLEPPPWPPDLLFLTFNRGCMSAESRGGKWQRRWRHGRLTRIQDRCLNTRCQGPKISSGWESTSAVCLFHLHLATVPQKHRACLVTQSCTERMRWDQRWKWSAKWRAVKKLLEVNIKQAVDNVERIYGEAVVRFVWTLEPLLGFLETKARRHCLTHSLQEGKKKKKPQVHLLLRPGFSIKSFLQRLWRVLAIAAKKWHFPYYKAYYIMLWISQDAHEWPQHTVQLTAGYTVAQFLRVPLIFLILRAECIDRADRVICPASSPRW